MTALALDLADLQFGDTLRRHWRALAVIALMAGLWVAAAFSVATQSGVRPEIARPSRVSPEVERMQVAVRATSADALRPIAPETAATINASIPIANLANPAARPFAVGFASPADRARSLECLTTAIYYEAATEPLDGQRAVAQVILNRVRHPAYPSSVCGVVFQGAQRRTGCQFSFTCDGSLRRPPMAAYWNRARTVAQAALNGYVHGPVGWATHYHANYVVPYWASSLTKSATVGLHIFYRWPRGAGGPGAFGSRYAGREPAIDWRGGFGQPDAAEASALADSRDAAAAQAAAEAAPAGSVDSFQRAVLRRYEPLRRDTATAMIAERSRADRTMTPTQRWALTGTNENSASQAPLGRRAATPEPPRELQGVRYRWDPAPGATAQPAPQDAPAQAAR
jgi:spore germination cell wall hydrolase CwlJ-like protein